jgi:Putative protein-S-isoprenylcysteine methyltransferase
MADQCAATAGLAISHPVLDLLGGLLVGAGLVLMLLAVAEMRRRKTTVIPHLEADALVTTGVFSRSRNPIYLGDALVLAGLALRWDAPVALLLVPLFMANADPAVHRPRGKPPAPQVSRRFCALL